MYFFINLVSESERELGTVRVPVYAPGEIWITEITVSEILNADPPITDYSLHFSPCREINLFFIHLTELSNDLLGQLGDSLARCEEYSTGGDTYRQCSQRQLSIKLAAGDLIGSAGGNTYANALDLGAFDLRSRPRPYANPTRWSEKPLYVACPLDYFEPEVREILYRKLGQSGGRTARVIPPLCGEVEQDEPGTAQGAWFVQGSTAAYLEDPHLALVHDNIDPSRAVFSVGTSMAESGLDSGLYYLMPLASGFVNRDFRDVEPGNVYCYERLIDRSAHEAGVTIILELTDPATLRIERVAFACGDGPWSFGESSTTFER